MVETVQSSIASEKPGMFDIFREGFMRLLNWGSGPKGRMLPIWMLIIPSVTVSISRYFFSLAFQGTASKIMHLYHKHKQENTGVLPRNLPNTSTVQEIEFNANLISLIASDIVFYPCETILHRLHLQVSEIYTIIVLI